MKIKIGENVRVKLDLLIGYQYDEYYFVDTMKRYRGVETTITRICDDGSMRIAADNSRHYWTETMFESLDTESGFYDISTIETIARNEPITVQRFEGGWKIIEKENKPK